MDMKAFMEVMTTIADWTIPLLILFIPVYAHFKGIKVYERFVEGAKEGFDISVRIMPYLVAILVAIGLFRASGAMYALAEVLSPVTSFLKMPVEILTLAILRPLSGSGASGFMVEIFNTYGPDSYRGLLASVMVGSTETTFYVLAVYFGAVNIKKTRHAVAAGLAGDIAGALAAVVLCYIVFGDLYTP